MGLLQKKKTIDAPDALVIAPLNEIEEYVIPVFLFSIEMGTETVALFQQISGMSVTRDVESVEVGGENDFGREFPGKVSYGHITFHTGLSSSDFFWKWMMKHKEIGFAHADNFTLVQRRSDPAKLTTEAAPGEAELPHYEEVKRWNFMNAFPVSWKISDLSVDNSNNIVIETLELSFDFFELA